MNIHILSNSPKRVNSGFGVVTRNIALELKKKGYNISISDMQNIYNIEYWNEIKIYPMNSIEGATGNNFYINEIQQLIKNLQNSKADILIIIYPAYDNVIISNHLHEIFTNTIWYYMVEGKNIPKVYTNELKKVKKIITATKQGLKELKKTKLKNIHHKEIYHGFNPNDFYNLNINNKNDSDCLHYCKWAQERYMDLQDKKTICERGCIHCKNRDAHYNHCPYYEEEKIIANINGDEFIGKISNLAKLKDQFGVETIFGFVGQNNGVRKKIDKLLEAYSILQKNTTKNDTMLLLHTLPYSNNGLNLWEYIEKYNLKTNVIFTYGEENLSNTWSTKALNIFYNIIDVNVSASSAEGFGLPTIESMACKKSNIGPRFSSFIELIEDKNSENKNNKHDRGLLADIEKYEKTRNNMIRGLVSTISLAECMETLHYDKKHRNDLASNAYEWVWNNCTWEKICDQFDNLLKNMTYEVKVSV